MLLVLMMVYFQETASERGVEERMSRVIFQEMVCGQ
jgi:hypothetical protein